MIRSAKWLAIPVLGFAFAIAGDAPQAEAQGFSIQFGNSGYGNSFYRSYRPAYGYGYGYAPGIQHRSYYGGFGTHHSLHPGGLHYGYRPPVVVPPVNRFNYLPGGHHMYHGGFGNRGCW